MKRFHRFCYLPTIVAQIFYLLALCGDATGAESVVGYEKGYSTEASTPDGASMTGRALRTWCDKISFSQPSMGTTRGINYQALMPKRELFPKGLSGAIVYTHFETKPITVLDRDIEIPVTRLYVMSGDGSGATLLINPGLYNQAQFPWWSADSRKLLFMSDHESARSALFMDIFAVDLSGGTVARLTGNEWVPQNSKGTGTIFGIIFLNDCSFSGTAESINISCQGMDGKVYHVNGEVQTKPPPGSIGNPHGESPRGLEDFSTVLAPKAKADLTGIQHTGFKYTIPDVPAGLVWVKCWFDKHMGDLKVVNVPVDGEALVDTMNLAQGNFLVSHPGLSPDGRYLVALLQHPFTQPNPKPQQQLGYDTLTVIDRRHPGRPPALWNPTEMGGRYAREPRISPDGKWIALAAGETGAESLVLCTVEEMSKGHPSLKEVRRGKKVLGSHTEGNSYPSWSPDGGRLAFVLYRMDTGGFRGNLCVINRDGNGFRRLTDLARNQCPGPSSWSPDGRKIAYQLITSKGPTLQITDILLRNIRSDIWVVNDDGSGNHALTRDGRSGQPAWGKPTL
jgi:Tol biopolymer transport system component